MSDKPRMCVIDGCQGKVAARGWCLHHYDRWRRHGDPNAAIRIRGKTEIRACLVCGKPVKVIAANAKRKKFCSRKCNGVWSASRGTNKWTGPENLFAAALRRRGVRFEWQVPIAGFVADFLLRKPPIVVEVDGEFWHNLPKNRARDARKDEALKRMGFVVVRIPSAQVCRSADLVVDELIRTRGVAVRAQLGLALVPYVSGRCSISGCSRKPKSRGWCGAHYLRFRKFGDPLGSAMPRPKRFCSIPGCGRIHLALGLCRYHWRRQWDDARWAGKEKKHKPVGNALKGEVVCSEPGCQRAARHLGLCGMHYQRRWHERRKAA